MLKTLEEQGLIVRSPHPRHPSVLELRMTEAGQEALATARRLAEPVERQVLGSFSADELEILGALLTRWAQAFAAARPRRS